MTITNVIIKTPDRKMRLGCEGHHAWKRSVSCDLTLGEVSPAGGYGMRNAFVGSVELRFDFGPGESS